MKIFLHIGNDRLVLKKDILLIIDIKKSKEIEINKEFFNIADEEGFLVDKIEKPKSYIITQRGNEDSRIKKTHIKTYIYESEISARTLVKRFMLDEKNKKIV